MVASAYQTTKLYTCARKKHYKHNEDGRTEPGVRGHGSVPLSHPGNVVTRILHTHTASSAGDINSPNSLVNVSFLSFDLHVSVTRPLPSFGNVYLLRRLV